MRERARGCTPLLKRSLAEPVSYQVTKKLNVATPPPQLVDAYLKEIAKGYGIDWSPLRPDANSDDEGLKVDVSSFPPLQSLMFLTVHP